MLIHAGTNDLNSDPPVDPYDTAANRLGALIDEVIAACPDATVLVAQIITNPSPATKARIRTFNAQVSSVVDARIAKGHQNIAAVDFSSITDNDLVDRLHPTDEGYSKMGDIWFSAIQEAASKGWINAPVGPDPSGGGAGRQECVSGLFWYQAQRGAQIAAGVGHGGSAKFVPNYEAHGQVAAGIGQNATGVQLQDLDGDGECGFTSVLGSLAIVSAVKVVLLLLRESAFHTSFVK